MTGAMPPTLALSAERWLREIEALRLRYPALRQHSADVGAAVFELTIEVEGIDRHLRMTLPSRYPKEPPMVREVLTPGGSVILPPGTRRFPDGTMCLFPHANDPQGWNRERLAVEALIKAEQFLARENHTLAAGGRLQQDDKTLILPPSIVNVMPQPGAFGTLQLASLSQDARELFAVHIHMHNPELSFPAAIEPQWASRLLLTKEIPWASVSSDCPVWEVLLRSRADLDDWLQRHLAASVFARLRAAEAIVLVRSSTKPLDMVAIHRPPDDLGVLRLPAILIGTPSNVLFSRVDAVMPQRARLAETEVVVVGLGSLGGATAVALARAGIGRFLLIDHDRLSLANVTRHVGGLQDVGRLKVEIIRSAILAINPAAEVQIIPKPLAWDIPPFSAVPALEQWLDVHPLAMVVATFVFGPIEQQLNELLVRRDVPAIYASVLGAAEHGRVFRVIPGQTPCFECVLDAQDAAPDEHPRFATEGDDEDEHRAYHEPSLPGLAIDIGHIALITARFALQTIARVRGVDVGLPDEDGHHLLWTNRGDWRFDRPLQLRVERISRNPRCSVCSPSSPSAREEPLPR